MQRLDGRTASGLIVGLVVGVAAARFLFPVQPASLPSAVVPQVSVPTPPSATVAEPVLVPMANEAPGTRLNCKMSGGTFKDGHCVCTIESFQTQEQMYDRATGFCQSTVGGPAGVAFAMSIGLPWGDYGYLSNIMFHYCTASGGTISGAACICHDGKKQDKETGLCSS